LLSYDDCQKLLKFLSFDGAMEGGVQSSGQLVDYWLLCELTNQDIMMALEIEHVCEHFFFCSQWRYELMLIFRQEGKTLHCHLSTQLQFAAL